MRSGRKVRAAPCGQRMSVFRALECAGSGALVQQRCSSARLACSSDQAVPAGNSRAAGACLQPQQDGATSSEGASSPPVQRNKSRITAKAALLALCSSGAH